MSLTEGTSVLSLGFNKLDSSSLLRVASWNRVRKMEMTCQAAAPLHEVTYYGDLMCRSNSIAKEITGKIHGRILALSIYCQK